MQKITLLTVGSIKTQWIREGCQEYIARLLGPVNLEIVEVPASKAKDPEKQREEESSKLLDATAKRNGMVWVLDETGKEMTSEGLALSFSQLKDEGQNLILILGGAYGLNQAVRDAADRSVALSQMTFPHELCRLILLEQLYRAVQIQRGSGYHH